MPNKLANVNISDNNNSSSGIKSLTKPPKMKKEPVVRSEGSVVPGYRRHQMVSSLTKVSLWHT